MAEVRLENITKRFDDLEALKSVSMTIEDGAFVVLLGPTGAGKTTTLRVLSGLESPDDGQVFINQRNVTQETPAQRDVAMVFQQYSLYPHLSVRRNLEFPLKSPVLKTPKADVDRIVQQVADVLQISHKLDNKATELSGGEMQRVSIGRALVREPAIHLMDEPLSSLDAKLRADLRIELKRLQSELGATMLYVTHDQIEAMTLATQVGVLDNGSLVQFGSPREVYENPNSIYVATRLGIPRINTVPADLFPGSPVQAHTVGMRPEHIRFGEGQPARIQRIEHLGDHSRLHLDCQGHPLVTLADTDMSVSVGDELAIGLQKPLYFDSNGQRVG